MFQIVFVLFMCPRYMVRNVCAITAQLQNRQYIRFMELPNIMLIKEGITKCFFTEENDKKYILEFLGGGEVIGEIEFDLKLNNLLLDVFAERIINTSSSASYQQLNTIEYSLSKLLELQSKQEISISKEDMASYLGITVRSLNRAFKKLSA